MDDFNKLYTDLTPKVKGAVWNRVDGITQEDLEDAVGFAWRKLVEKQPEGDLLAWLITVAYHEALKLSRTRQRKPTIPMIDDPEDPAYNPEATRAEDRKADPQDVAEAREALREGIERIAELPDRQRRIWLRRNYLGQTPEEIAEAEGISDRTYRKEIEKANRHMLGE